MLVVLRPVDRSDVGRVQQTIRAAGGGGRRRLRVMTAAEVVCVDGVGGVEAVVVRHIASGRLFAFTARAVVMATTPVGTG